MVDKVIKSPTWEASRQLTAQLNDVDGRISELQTLWSKYMGTIADAAAVREVQRKGSESLGIF